MTIGLHPLLLLFIVLSLPCTLAHPSPINLLPFGSIELHPDIFYDDSQVCTDQQVLAAHYESFALPINTTDGYLIHVSAVVHCDAQQQQQQQGVLFSLGRQLQVSVDCQQRSLLLTNNQTASTAIFAIPEAFKDSKQFNLTLSIDLANDNNSNSNANTQHRIISINGIEQSLSSIGTLGSNSLVASGVSYGCTTDYKNTARATLTQFWLLPNNSHHQANSCSLDTSSCLQPTAAGLNTNALPVITQFHYYKSPEPQQQHSSSDTVFVAGDRVGFSLQAQDTDNDPLHASLTFFGVTPEDCSSPDCGDLIISTTTNPSLVNNEQPGLVLLTTTVHYPKPGKFLIRATISDGSGIVTIQDTTILIRKQGDITSQAACCKTTPFITAQQKGRPVHDTIFRPPWVITAGADTLKWWGEYMTSNDVEAERLFDYTILAPLPVNIPFSTVTCHDTRLAGAGSPVLDYGRVSSTSTGSGTSEVQGHNKKLVIIPLAFPWAVPDDVDCQSHWSGWQDQSPYARHTHSTSGSCSVGCTQAGTSHLLANTAMFDQFNQALIQSSNGALSLSFNVSILPEVLVPRNQQQQGSDVYDYYSQPALRALEASALPYWQYIVVSPLVYHRVPNHHAWSGGMYGKNVVVTQCYVSMYHAVHETGHRLGFSHANLYKLLGSNDGSSNSTFNKNDQQPVRDPLFSSGGVIPTNGYSDKLDVMGCCKSDYGLVHRTQAGWLSGRQRVVYSKADLKMKSTKSFVLWPFDRSESKGKLVSIALRLAGNQVVVLGYRSASHWQDAGPGVGAEEVRQNVRGLQVEYLARSGGVGVTMSSAGSSNSSHSIFAGGSSGGVTTRSLLAVNTNIGQATDDAVLVKGGKEEEHEEEGHVHYQATGGGSGSWSDRALLDFNLLYMDFPEALPLAAGQVSKKGEFALLKEARSWYIPSTSTLISFQRIASCDTPAFTPTYNYTARDFYGYRGEPPGAQEKHVKLNYSGYSGLECAHLVVETAAQTPTGTLDITVVSANANILTDTLEKQQQQQVVLVKLSWSEADRGKVSVVVVKDNATNNTMFSILPSVTDPLFVDVPLPDITNGTASCTAYFLTRDGRQSAVKLLLQQQEQEEQGDAKGNKNRGVLAQHRKYTAASIQTTEEWIAVNNIGAGVQPVDKKIMIGLIAGVAVLSVLLLVLTACVVYYYLYGKKI